MSVLGGGTYGCRWGGRITGNVAETVTFERQQTMHIANVSQVIAPTRFRADTLLPGMNEFEDARHDRARERRWAFGEPSDELV